jgi:CBS domain-containing protein
MSIGTICSRDVQVATLDEGVVSVARRMRAHNVGSVVVVGPDRRPEGILTDRDLALRIVGESRPIEGTKVRDIVTKSPLTVPEDMSVDRALEVMRAGSMRRLPVVGKDGRLAGLVSLDDVLWLFAEEFQEIGGLLHHQEPRR